MARPNSIWFRKDIGWWMVTIGGKKLRLAQGRTQKAEALRKFHELMAVRPTVPESPSARVADILEAFLAWSQIHLSVETNRNYIWYGQAFSENSGYITALDLKPIHVTRWVDERKWGQTTERNARRSIFRAFSWACEQGVLPRNPLQGMKCPGANTRPRGMTDEEYRIILRNSGTDFKMLVFALKESGCRPSEARRLRWNQVREDRWILQQHKTAHKVRKPRIIFLTEPMQRLMALLRKRATADHVFLNARSKPWSSNAVRLRINRLKDKDNVNLSPDVCAYMLRHAFGTNAVVNGVDVATVAELMGNSVEIVSKVYLHLSDQQDHLKGALEKATHRVSSKPPRDGPNQAA